MNQASEHDLHLGKLLGSAALGALAMYMLDPDRGAPRRAQSGEKLRDLGRQTGDMLDKMVKGVGERGNALFSHPGNGSSHGQSQSPSHKTAGGKGSASSLSGDAASDADSTGSGEQRDTGQGVASSGLGRIRESLVSYHGNPREWAPSVRGAAMLGGSGLGVASMFTRRSPMALMMGLAGAALLYRAASNHSLRATVANMAGMQGGGKPVTVERAIHIKAPVERVYELCSNYENFPRFMSNVVEVSDLGDRRSHWVVKGPAGSQFEYNSVLTEQSPPRRLAWESEPGSEVEQSGAIRMESVGDGTRVTVKLSYRPPAGSAGQAVASLLGDDPKHQLEENLQRMKEVLEADDLVQASRPSVDSEGQVLH